MSFEIIKTREIPTRRVLAFGKAAAYLGMAPNTLKRLVEEGVIPARWDRHLGRRFFLIEDLDGYIDDQPRYTGASGESPSEKGDQKSWA